MKQLESLIAHASEQQRPPLIAIYDRHNLVSFQQQEQEDADDEAIFRSSVLNNLDGLAPEEAAWTETLNHEEFLHFVEDRLFGDQAAQQADRKAKKKPSAAETKRAAEEQANHLSVREIFRKLASDLHPDREQDPVAKERKTALMQRLNQAYQANDLLALLSLQIEIEQIAAIDLKNMSEQRLAQYNKVLNEQLKTVKDSCAQRIDQLSSCFPMHMPRLRQPKDVKKHVNEHVYLTQKATHYFNGCAARLTIASTCNAELDDLVQVVKHL
jgi:hypothetical protein